MLRKANILGSPWFNLFLISFHFRIGQLLRINWRPKKVLIIIFQTQWTRIIKRLRKREGALKSWSVKGRTKESARPSSLFRKLFYITSVISACPKELSSEAKRGKIWSLRAFWSGTSTLNGTIIRSSKNAEVCWRRNLSSKREWETWSSRSWWKLWPKSVMSSVKKLLNKFMRFLVKFWPP